MPLILRIDDVRIDSRPADFENPPGVGFQGHWYKSQQMRWSRQGANLLLQVRCAVDNGTLGFGYGQKFHPANDTHPHPQAIAA
jgi:hypothetical protein